MTKLCARGEAAARAKFSKISAYRNGYGVLVCKGKAKGLDGKKVNSYGRKSKTKRVTASARKTK